jgi:hypothetical protein
MLLQVPIPPGEIWQLFPNLAVIILIMVVMFAGLGLIWREYRAYQKDQDKKREAERERQRLWEEEQDKIRDERWQNFIRAMQAVSAREEERNREQLADMATSINQLSDSSRKVAELVDGLIEKVTHLTGTVTNHIAVDDARFDVLLSDQQRQAIDAQVATAAQRPRKKI